MKAFSFLSTTSGKAMAIVVGFLVIASGAYVYGKTTGNNIVLRAGGKGYGIIFDENRGTPSVVTGEYGCCLPFCSDTFEIECSPEHGYDGTFNSESCSQINQCEEGCCQVDCLVKENFPNSACTNIGGEWSPGACTIGCCTLDDGSTTQLPEKTCLECSGGVSWNEGECGKGFEANLHTIETRDFAEDASMELNFNLHTCGQKAGSSSWQGNWSWDWNVPSMGITNNASGEISFDAINGTANTTLGFQGESVPATVSVNSSQMSISYNHPTWNNITATGSVTKGSDKCGGNK